RGQSRGGGRPCRRTRAPGRRRMTEPIDILEALLFASDTPVETATIREVLDLESPDAARDLVDALAARLREGGRALQVIEVGGGFRLVTRPEVAPSLVQRARP